MSLSHNLPERWLAMRGDMLSGMTTERMAAVLRAHDRGYIREGQMLFAQIEARDPDILASAPKRRSAAAARPWDVVVRSDLDDRQQAEARLHREALLRFYNTIQVRDALDLDSEGEVRLLVEQCANAVFSGYAVHNIVWRPRGADLSATLIHCPAALFETTRGGLSWAGPEQQLGKDFLDRRAWCVTRGYGLSYGLAIQWLLSSITLRDQLQFLSRYGLPGVLGKTPHAKGTPDRADFEAAVTEFGNLWAAVMGDGNSVELVEASASGGDQWAALRDELRRAKITICMGSDLSTLSRKDGAGASLQGGDNDKLVINDLLMVSESLNRRLDRLVIAYIFGEGVEPLAYFRLSPPEVDESKSLMERFRFFSEMGVPVDLNELAESFGHSLPEPGARLANSANAPSLDRPLSSQAQLSSAAAAAVRDDLRAILDALASAAQSSTDKEATNRVASLAANLPQLTAAVLRGESLEGLIFATLGEELLLSLGLQSIIEEVTATP